MLVQGTWPSQEWEVTTLWKNDVTNGGQRSESAVVLRLGWLGLVVRSRRIGRENTVLRPGSIGAVEW